MTVGALVECDGLSDEGLGDIEQSASPLDLAALADAPDLLVGAVGGILVTPITLTSYDAGTLLALKAFAGAMLGGIGSAFGAVLGGLLLGLLEAFSAGYLSSQYKDAVAFLVILAVLLVRPEGLLGRAGVERV